MWCSWDILEALGTFNISHIYNGVFSNTVTAKNSVIPPNFLVWKLCGKAQFPQQEIRWNHGIFRSVYALCDSEIFCFLENFIIWQHLLREHILTPLADALWKINHRKIKDLYLFQIFWLSENSYASKLFFIVYSNIISTLFLKLYGKDVSQFGNQTKSKNQIQLD